MACNTIVCYNVVCWFIYYRGPPMVMDAILATIVHGHTEGKQLMTLTERLVETNYFLFNL